jgi:hypothetical protein
MAAGLPAVPEPTDGLGRMAMGSVTAGKPAAMYGTAGEPAAI